MPVENISGLIQNLSDQLLGQGQSNNVQKSLVGTGTSVSPAAVEDTFTPSAQTDPVQAPAQDAGLFQFAPGTLTAIQTNSTVAPTPGQVPLPGSTQTLTPANGGTAAPVQSQINNPAEQATASATGAASLQLQIRSLNASLPALGLTNTEINQIDRIASLVQNFNPASYASLVSQFETLAQNSGSTAPANAAALATPGAAASGSNPANKLNNSAYQVQGISLQFTGSTQPGSSSFAGGGGKNTDGNSTQANSAGVQIGKVQFTLVNGNGQTVQVQAP